MEADLYEEFLALKERGDRKGAATSVRRFCDSFESWSEKESWTRAFLESGEYGHRIRHEVYVEVVLPVLLEGYRRREHWSTYWLARTCQSLYQAKKVHAELGYPSALSLLHECYEIDPEHPPTRDALLASQIDWLEHCIHEWPAGVLYGADGASRQECGEILEAVELARRLDVEDRHQAFLDEVAEKTIRYSLRLGVP